MERSTNSSSLFFGGCVKLTAVDCHLHDTAKSCTDSIWQALAKYRIEIAIKDCQILLDKFSSLHTDWIQKEEVSRVELELHTKLYSGPKQVLVFVVY